MYKTTVTLVCDVCGASDSCTSEVYPHSIMFYELLPGWGGTPYEYIGIGDQGGYAICPQCMEPFIEAERTWISKQEDECRRLQDAGRDVSAQMEALKNMSRDISRQLQEWLNANPRPMPPDFFGIDRDGNKKDANN